MTVSRPGILGRAIAVFIAAALLLGALFFGAAGTFDYWQAWLYMAVLLLPMMGVLAYLLRRDPDLLDRRLRARERRAPQQGVVQVSSLFLLLAFVIPGLSQRFGWPTVSPAISIAGCAVVLLGYGLFVQVLRVNSYAARTVEIEAGQRVVTTGPYRFVRHPMYVAVIVIYLVSPLALGSAWAVLPALPLPALIVARIRDEERMLVDGLPGYREYQRSTRYRLIPGIW